MLPGSLPFLAVLRSGSRRRPRGRGPHAEGWGAVLSPPARRAGGWVGWQMEGGVGSQGHRASPCCCNPICEG